MADKKLNEVTKVTDMAYVPVIMADGSVGQIAKSDLASVVAEQMNTVGNAFYTAFVAGSQSMGNPKAVAEEVLASLPDKDISFQVIHQYSGLRVVSGYTYRGKKYGVLNIKEFGGNEISYFVYGGEFTQRLDNFGYNSLAELAGGVAENIGLGNFKVRKVQTSHGGSSVYFRGLSNSSITYVVDASDRTKYILSHTYYNIDGSDVVSQTVISNNVLSFGASNKGGTQVINGTTNDVIFYIMYFV